MPELFHPELAALTTRAIAETDLGVEPRSRVLAIGFFDLAGSTAAKIRLGHERGTHEALVHNSICRTVISAFGGSVRKDLGDGVLAIFENPLDSVLAAVNVVTAVAQADLASKVGLSFGLAEERKITGRWDVLGAVVDRAARIQSLARSGQILADEAVVAAVETYLSEFSELQVGPVQQREVRGIATVRVREVRQVSESPFVVTGPVWIEETGRPSIEDKVRFLTASREEIIEVGAGLTTLVDYYFSQPAPRFRDRMDALVKEGVTLRYLLANPDSPRVQAHFTELGEPAYIEEIRRSIEKLRELREQLGGSARKGNVELRLSDEPPSVSAIGVDVGIDDPSPRGMFLISHYLLGVPRSDTPVIHLDAASNGTMFSKYWTSIRNTWNAARDIP
jgi:class 3 adenylate cyclase